MPTGYTAPTKDALADLDAYASKAPHGTAERALLIFGWLADRAYVRETEGANRGPWMRLFLGECGLGEGYSWCAASLTWACRRAGCWSGNSPAVIDWYRRGKADGRLRAKPARALACYRLDRDEDGNLTGHGHIGFCLGYGESLFGRIVRKILNLVKSIEGNTSPAAGGSQSNGDGLYRKTRPIGYWDGYVELSQEGR